MYRSSIVVEIVCIRLWTFAFKIRHNWQIYPIRQDAFHGFAYMCVELKACITGIILLNILPLVLRIGGRWTCNVKKLISSMYWLGLDKRFLRDHTFLESGTHTNCLTLIIQWKVSCPIQQWRTSARRRLQFVYKECVCKRTSMCYTPKASFE